MGGGGTFATSSAALGACSAGAVVEPAARRRQTAPMPESTRLSPWNGIGRGGSGSASSGLPVMAPIFNPDPAEARRQRDDCRARGAALFVAGTDKIIVADAMARYASAVR
jgi:hypothetical protein